MTLDYFDVSPVDSGGLCSWTWKVTLSVQSDSLYWQHTARVTACGFQGYGCWDASPWNLKPTWGWPYAWRTQTTSSASGGCATLSIIPVKTSNMGINELQMSLTQAGEYPQPANLPIKVLVIVELRWASPPCLLKSGKHSWATATVCLGPWKWGWFLCGPITCCSGAACPEYSSSLFSMILFL